MGLGTCTWDFGLYTMAPMSMQYLFYSNFYSHITPKKLRFSSLRGTLQIGLGTRYKAVLSVCLTNVTREFVPF